MGVILDVPFISDSAKFHSLDNLVKDKSYGNYGKEEEANQGQSQKQVHKTTSSIFNWLENIFILVLYNLFDRYFMYVYVLRTLNYFLVKV